MSLKGLISKLQKPVLFLLFLSFPTQLAKHFWPSFSFIWGIRVDYLSPTIYLSDVLSIFLIFIIIFQTGLRELLRNLKFQKAFVLIAVYVILNILFSRVPEASIIKWIKIVEMGLLAFVFSIIKFKNIKTEIIFPLTISSFAISLIGIAQFIKGSTVGGLLYYLGERRFSIISPGIALMDIGGREYLRAYSTFSHPNSLAGYLLVIVVLVFFLGASLRPLLIPILLCLLLAFSKGSMIALLVVISIYFVNKIRKDITGKYVNTIFLIAIAISLLMLFWKTDIFLFESIKISERIYLMNVSRTLFLDNIFFGVGLNNYILEIPKLVSQGNFGWMLQPVHNILILSLVEGGLFGFVMFGYLIVKALSAAIKEKRLYLTMCILIVLITGIFDHYWLTLQQNMLIFSLVLGLTFNKKFK